VSKSAKKRLEDLLALLIPRYVLGGLAFLKQMKQMKQKKQKKKNKKKLILINNKVKHYYLL